MLSLSVLVYLGGSALAAAIGIKFQIRPNGDHSARDGEWWWREWDDISISVKAEEEEERWKRRDFLVRSTPCMHHSLCQACWPHFTKHPSSSLASKSHSGEGGEFSGKTNYQAKCHAVGRQALQSMNDWLFSFSINAWWAEDSTLPNREDGRPIGWPSTLCWVHFKLIPYRHTTPHHATSPNSSTDGRRESESAREEGEKAPPPPPPLCPIVSVAHASLNYK